MFIKRVFRNKKGQVAIFIVLVFQALFILFAMSLNVAMVVYDKINMQNSLDLAAYYGAKKQAEVLNTMAHINYQLRQNWKLLAWRYRILGTLIQYQGYPSGSPVNTPYWCPQNKPGNIDCDSSLTTECQAAQELFNPLGLYPGYCDKEYFTCISHDLWERGMPKTDSQNLCTTEDVNIKPITTLPIVAPFTPSSFLASAAVEELKRATGKSTPLEGALNWLTVQLFLTQFRLDQKDRKIMLKEIYKKTLKEGKDLDGEDIFEGTKKVFYHNLTAGNKKNVESQGKDYGLQEYNSFENKDFNEVFGELFVRPILNYLDAPDGTIQTYKIPHILINTTDSNYDTVTEETLIDFINRRFDTMPSLRKRLVNEAIDLISYNMWFTENNDPMASLTLSFYKKTEQTLYYAIATEFDYKSENQIFSLRTSIPFKGSAFAKAFGGFFGPQPEQSDPFIPTHHSDTPLKFVTDPKQMLYSHQPNHSRWPGDEWGLVDSRLHDPKKNLSFLNKQMKFDIGTQKVYSIENYFSFILGGFISDPLVRDMRRGDTAYHFVRMMEWMAVYPDLYDINHYSILGNYHQTYFKKVCKLLLGGSECQKDGLNEFTSEGIKAYVRGDFGWPNSDNYLEKNRDTGIDLSIAPYFLKKGTKVNPEHLEAVYTPPSYNLPPPRYQYSSEQLIGFHDPNIINPSHKGVRPPLTQGNLFYPWLASELSAGEPKPELPGGLLSSWFNPKPLDYQNYDFDTTQMRDHFLTCDHKAVDDMPVPSSCVGLGRTGYSIKLISCSQMEKLQPQPPNKDAYCN